MTYLTPPRVYETCIMDGIRLVIASVLTDGSWNPNFGEKMGSFLEVNSVGVPSG